jgi:hypothetical protein
VDGVGSHPRMTRIATALCDSQLSIHDLSRWKGEEPQYLARMNMPFELGMAVEMQRAHAVSQSNMAHEWLVLAPQATPLDHVLSDLKAYDHELYQDRSDMVRKVVNWLLKWRHDLRLPRLRVPADRVADALATLDQLLLQQRPMGQHAREAWGTTVGVAQQHARSVLP